MRHWIEINQRLLKLIDIMLKRVSVIKANSAPDIRVRPFYLLTRLCNSGLLFLVLSCIKSRFGFNHVSWTQTIPSPTATSLIKSSNFCPLTINVFASHYELMTISNHPWCIPTLLIRKVLPHFFQRQSHSADLTKSWIWTFLTTVLQQYSQPLLLQMSLDPFCSHFLGLLNIQIQLVSICCLCDTLTASFEVILFSTLGIFTSVTTFHIFLYLRYIQTFGNQNICVCQRNGNEIAQYQNWALNAPWFYLPDTFFIRAEEVALCEKKWMHAAFQKILYYLNEERLLFDWLND